MRRYSDFIALLPATYEAFTASLLEDGEAYSGLAARHLATNPEAIAAYLSKNGVTQVLIAGPERLEYRRTQHYSICPAKRVLHKRFGTLTHITSTTRFTRPDIFFAATCNDRKFSEKMSRLQRAWQANGKHCRKTSIPSALANIQDKLKQSQVPSTS